MLKKQNKYKMVAFLAFALYFLTGAACIVVGSSLSHLVKMYGIALDKVVLLGSAYALGRVLTVYFTGRMVEKFGPIKSTGSRNRADWSILNRNTHCACILCRFGFCISWWNWNGNSRYSVPGIIKYGIS